MPEPDEEPVIGGLFRLGEKVLDQEAKGPEPVVEQRRAMAHLIAASPANFLAGTEARH